MRPLLLKMKGFESYVKETEIDFEKLGDRGLYRITGETGAGKTTIFDAIAFALYGEPSGDNRDLKTLRSLQLKEDEKGFVDLTFSVGKEKFRVFRDLVNDKGVTKSKKITLEYFDGRPPVEAVTKVNAEISENILKMNRKDFCQIEMIAQGAFEKFLLAKTEEKEKIFREIFRTEKYMKFQEELKNKSLSLGKQQAEALRTLMIFLNQITEEDMSDEDKKVFEDLKATQQFDEESVYFLKTIVAEDEKRLKKISDEYEKVSGQKSETEKKLEKARQKMTLEKSIETAEKEKIQAESEKADLEKEWETAKSRKGEQEKLSAEKTKLELLLPKYEEVTLTEKKVSELKSALERDEDKKKQLKVMIQTAEKNIWDLKENLKNLSGAGENQSRLENELKEKNDREKELNEISSELVYLKNLKSLIAEKKEKAAAAIKNWQEEEKRYRHEETVFYSQQAGILAEGLKDGDPCPVCGNIHHIKLAEKTAGALNRDQLDELAKKVKALEKIRNDSSTESQVALKEEEEKTLVAMKKLRKFFDFVELNSEAHILEAENLVKTETAVLEKECVELNEKIRDEEANIEKRKQLEEALPEKEECLEKCRQEESSVTVEIASKTTEISEKTAILESLKKELDFDSQNAAEARVRALDREIKAIDDAVEKAEKALNQCVQKIAEVHGMISAGKEQLAGFEKYDFEKLSEEEFRIKTELQKLIEDRDRFNGKLGKNRDNVKSIEALVPEYKNLKKKYETVKKLNDIAGAATGMGNEDGRITLETFIQMQYLEKVLAYANNRLSIMSDGVYDLVRSTVKKSGSSKTGLDLNIYDHNACSERPVESLSGGEKFQASLALALGLADEISMSGSGLKMESMFIDEGFATLDPSSLKKVMKTLNDLSSSNRLIGIISHVGALDGEIPKTIDVVKDKTTGISSAKVNIES